MLLKITMKGVCIFTTRIYLRRKECTPFFEMISQRLRKFMRSLYGNGNRQSI